MRLCAEFHVGLDALQQNGRVVEEIKKKHERTWLEIVTNGHVQKNINSNSFMNAKGANEWIEILLLSYLKGYIAGTIEQE